MTHRILILALAVCFGGLARPLRAQPVEVQGERVTAQAVPQRMTVAPGDNLAIAIVVQYEPGWHSWPNKPVLPTELKGTDTTPTEIGVVEKELHRSVRIVLAAIQWPAPVTVETGAFGDGAAVKVLSYTDRMVAYVPVIIAPDAPKGTVTIPFTYTLQACNETTCIATQTLALPVVLTIADAAGEPDRSDLFDGFNPAVYSRILAGEIVDTWEFDFLGYKFSVGKHAYVLIFLIALAAGFLMNFTPCVLPVIPIKILSIQSHAKSPGKLAYFGTLYCIGIVFLYFVLGLLAFGLITGGKKFDWGQIFTIPWFVIAMSAIIGVMAIGMMGLFSIRLPNAVYMVNPTGETATGNFLGGVLTGVLAVPCTGPLLGATLAWILTQPPVVGLLTFATMGVGMALPYAVLIAFPRLVDRMPRGGPGGELLKQVIGLFMLAVAAYLAGNLTSDVWPWWIVGVVALAACAWWARGALVVLRSPTARSINAVLACLVAVVVAAATWSVTRPSPVDWRVFRNAADTALQSAIAEAVKRGDVVVVDFTAKWCVNCHVIEKNVLYSEVGLEVFRMPGVRPFKVDLTRAGDEEGWGTVRTISGGGGIPLIAIYGPGVDKPIYFQSFFKPGDLKEAVSKAAGKPSALRNVDPSGKGA